MYKPDNIYWTVKGNKLENLLISMCKNNSQEEATIKDRINTRIMRKQNKIYAHCN